LTKKKKKENIQNKCFIIHQILAKIPIKMEPMVFLNPKNHL
jgi:hypothetical protein